MVVLPSNVELATFKVPSDCTPPPFEVARLPTTNTLSKAADASAPTRIAPPSVSRPPVMVRFSKPALPSARTSKARSSIPVASMTVVFASKPMISTFELISRSPSESPLPLRSNSNLVSVADPIRWDANSIVTTPARSELLAAIMASRSEIPSPPSFMTRFSIEDVFPLFSSSNVSTVIVIMLLGSVAVVAASSNPNNSVPTTNSNGPSLPKFASSPAAISAPVAAPICSASNCPASVASSAYPWSRMSASVSSP